MQDPQGITDQYNSRSRKDLARELLHQGKNEPLIHSFNAAKNPIDGLLERPTEIFICHGQSFT